MAKAKAVRSKYGLRKTPMQLAAFWKGLFPTSMKLEALAPYWKRPGSPAQASERKAKRRC
eukprot:14051423-Alexandrium_andersonii.AAC.1